MYAKYIKRPLDFILALTAIIILLPVFLVIGILVKIKLGSPVIFKQERSGKDEKIFTLFKFRTMTEEKDNNGELLPDSRRLTRFGKWLRSTSLDELPELINIIKGDMSFVGPRPLLVKYLPLYSEQQRKRHKVRPGLTGYAQVHGRNSISWEQKFDLDLRYVDNITFFTDIKIIFNTIEAVLLRNGITDNSNVTMEEFKGSNIAEEVHK